jgi:putative transposase
VPSTIRRYKYQVHPSPQAEKNMPRVFGAVRWVHNAYIAAAGDAYEAKKPHLNGFTGSKLIVTEGRANPETAWLQELPSNVLRASVMNAAKGYQAYFDSQSGKRKGPKMGLPRFKKRSSRQSAEFGRSSFSIK